MVLSEVECNIQFIINSLMYKIAPIVTRSMLYSQLNDRTQVDTDLTDLHKSGKIRQLSFRSASFDYIMLFKDFAEHLKQGLVLHNVPVDKLIDTLKTFSDQFYFTKVELKGKFCLSDNLIQTLTEDKYLSLNSDMKYEFTLPCSGNYVELLGKGKHRILSLLKRKPSQEILESELMEMKLRNCGLGKKLIIYDLIGSSRIKLVKCGMGNLIRLSRYTMSFYLLYYCMSNFKIQH